MHASSKIAKIAHPYENIEAAVSSSLPILEKKYSAILTINEEEAQSNAVIFATDPNKIPKCASEIKKIVDSWKWSVKVSCETELKKSCYEEYLKGKQFERLENAIVILNQDRKMLKETANSLPGLQTATLQYEAAIFEQLLGNRSLHGWLEGDLQLWSLQINYYTYSFILESYLESVLREKCAQFKEFIANLEIKIQLDAALQLHPFLKALKETSQIALTSEEVKIMSTLTYDKDGTGFLTTTLNEKEAEMSRLATLLDHFTPDLPVLSPRHRQILKLQGLQLIESSAGLLARKSEITLLNQSLEKRKKPIFNKKVQNAALWRSIFDITNPRYIPSLGGVFQISQTSCLLVYGNPSLNTLCSILHSVLQKSLSLSQYHCNTKARQQILLYFSEGWFRSEIQLFRLPYHPTSLFCYPSTPSNTELMASLLSQPRFILYSLLPSYLMEALVRLESKRKAPLISYLNQRHHIWVQQDTSDSLFWHLSPQQSELQEGYKKHGLSELEYAEASYARVTRCYEIVLNESLAFNYEALLGHTLQFKTMSLKTKPKLQAKEKQWLWRYNGAVLQGKWMNVLSLPSQFEARAAEKEAMEKIKHILELRAEYPEAWNVLSQLHSGQEMKEERLDEEEVVQFKEFLQKMKITELTENTPQEELKSDWRSKIAKCSRIQSITLGKALNRFDFEYKCARLPPDYLHSWPECPKPLIFFGADDTLSSGEYVICRVYAQPSQNTEHVRAPYPEYTFTYN